MLRFDTARQLKITEDANGFIRFSGIVAAVGDKLEYFNGGKVTVETVTEDALFGDMEDLNGAPVTNEHPRGLLTPKDASRYAKGSVIVPRRDGDELWVDGKVFDEKAISDIRNGKRGLSAGYACEVDSLGNQVKRKYNHIAICRKGRSSSSGIRSDSMRQSFNLEGISMHTIKFSSGETVNLDCDDAVAKLLQKNIDQISERSDSIEDERDGLHDFIMKLDADDEEMSIGDKMKKLKKDMAAAGEDKKKMSKLKAEYDALVDKDKKSSAKMDSADVMSMLETVKKCEKINAKLEVKNDSGEFKTVNEMIAESLTANGIKFDGHEEDHSYLIARLDAAVETGDAFSARGKHKPSAQTQRESAQERADSKFYGEE